MGGLSRVGAPWALVLNLVDRVHDELSKLPGRTVKPFPHRKSNVAICVRNPARPGTILVP